MEKKLTWAQFIKSKSIYTDSTITKRETQGRFGYVEASEISYPFFGANVFAQTRPLPSNIE